MTSADQSVPLEKLTAVPAGGRLNARVLGIVAVAVALLSALVTFVVLSDLTPIAPTRRVVLRLLSVNVLAVLALIGVIAREVWLIMQARRRGRAAARLHVRIVGLFAIIAAIPTILMAVVASITLDRGLDRFFSTRARAVQNSLIVSQA
jgi:two-component system, NtrC family, nitrogen regulation sensor histidine kinase NtrY